MSAVLTVSYYTQANLSDVRSTLLDVYAEVYAREIETDPFFSMERFEERLVGHTSGPGWACAVGDVEGDVIGYAYGFPKRSVRGWDGMVTAVDPDLLREDGRRTFALCEIMVRAPWRGKGIARVIHDELMSHRPEERASLLVERSHPRVRAMYESWGYRWLGERLPVPDSPLYDALLLPLR